MLKLIYSKKRIRQNLNFEFSESILQCLELTVQIVHQIFNLRLRIKYLNTLCVCIVSYTEWSRNQIRIFSDKKKLFKKNENQIEDNNRMKTYFNLSFASSKELAT